jgi:hypothetical protein
MAIGVPVVTTTEGVEGLPAVDGVHAGICDDDTGLVDRTVELLEDVGLQNRRRVAARRLVESACAPGPALDAIEAIYGRMTGRSGPLPESGNEGDEQSAVRGRHERWGL